MNARVEINTSTALMGRIEDALTEAQRLTESTQRNRPSGQDDESWEARRNLDDLRDTLEAAIGDLEAARNRMQTAIRDDGEGEHHVAHYLGLRVRQGNGPNVMVERYAPAGSTAISTDGRRESAILKGRNDLWNHSPDGFQWGYAGSGPAQLALAILAEHTRDDRYAVRRHQDFKKEVIQHIRQDAWCIEGEDVSRWIQDHP